MLNQVPSEEDAELFYMLRDLLAMHVNARLQISDRLVLPDADDMPLFDESELSHVLDQSWAHPELIDDFIATFDDHLEGRERGILPIDEAYDEYARLKPNGIDRESFEDCIHDAVINDTPRLDLLLNEGEVNSVLDQQRLGAP